MEEHIIFEQYTDMDKNINTLAQFRAKCIYMKHFNMCKEKCSKCRRNIKFKACYHELAICDQIKLDDTAENIAAFYINNKKDNDAREKEDNITMHVMYIIICMCIAGFIGVLICL